MLRRFIALPIAALVLAGLQFASAEEIDKSRVPPVETYRAMLDANKSSGWVQFRNYNGKQWIYFTALQVLNCRIDEIRYSINSEELDQRFNLVKCNPQVPFNMPSNLKISDTAIVLSPGEAKNIAVQVV